MTCRRKIGSYLDFIQMSNVKLNCGEKQKKSAERRDEFFLIGMDKPANRWEGFEITVCTCDMLSVFSSLLSVSLFPWQPESSASRFQTLI